MCVLFCPFYSFLFCFFLFFSGKQQTNNRIRIYSDRRVRRKKTRASWQIGSFSLHFNGKKCVICFGRDVLRVQIVEPVFRCSVLLSIYKLIFFSAFSFFFSCKEFSGTSLCSSLYHPILHISGDPRDVREQILFGRHTGNFACELYSFFHRTSMLLLFFFLSCCFVWFFAHINFAASSSMLTSLSVYSLFILM